MKRAWIPWLLVLALLSLGGLPHQRDQEVERAIDEGHFAFTPAGTVEAVRAYLTNDGDMRRYYAYVNAALGRAYQTHYVRPLAEWRKDFQLARPPDPDSLPAVTPPRPLVPYRDYLVEYPPGFFLWALPPALLPVSADAYVLLFAAFMALLLSAALAAALRLLPGLGERTDPALLWRWGAGCALALGVVATHRYDASVALLLAAMCLGALTGRPLLGGVAAGLAVATKITPALPALVLALYLLRGRRLGALVRFCAAAAVSAAALLLPAFWAAGPRLWDLIRYHADRPLQIESTGGALLIARRLVSPGSLTMVQTFGSFNMQGAGVEAVSRASGILTLAALALALLAIAWRLGRGSEAARCRAALIGVLQLLVLLMVLGKVFSPQYLVWILPLGLVASAGSLRARVLLLATLALTQLIYPLCYGPLSQLQPWAGLLVLLRNGLLLAWALLL